MCLNFCNKILIIPIHRWLKLEGRQKVKTKLKKSLTKITCDFCQSTNLKMKLCKWLLRISFVSLQVRLGLESQPNWLNLYLIKSKNHFQKKTQTLSGWNKMLNSEKCKVFSIMRAQSLSKLWLRSPVESLPSRWLKGSPMNVIVLLVRRQATQFVSTTSLRSRRR